MPSPTHVFPSPVQNGTDNTYTSTYSDNDEVSCIVTSSASCATGNPANSNTITVSISNNLPVSVYINADDNSICAGDNVVFDASPINEGTTPAYQWQVNGGDVGTNSSTFSSTTLNDGDFVSCILTSSETCTSGSPASSNNIVMTVDDVPVADFTNSATDLIVDFTNTSIDASTYLWNFGDGNSTNMPSPTHVFPSPGLYDVTLIAYNDCGSDTIVIQINVIIDNINDISITNSLAIYPNPTKGELNIEFENYNKSDINIEIYNVLGSIIKRRTIENTYGKYTEVFDMSSYNKGIYMLIIHSDNNRTVEKIVVE